MKVMFLIPCSKAAKNVARDLVYGCWCNGKRIGGLSFPPVSLALVAAVLKNAGIEVSLVDEAVSGISEDGLKNLFREHDLYVVLTSSVTLKSDAARLAEIKSLNKKAVTVVFGGHVTAEPEGTLASNSAVDILARREPEYIVRDLALAIKAGKSWKTINGISYREAAGYKHNPDYAFIEDLNDLPMPDRSLIPQNAVYFNPVVKRMPYTTVFTSRGCPGECVFCASPTFYGRKIRFRGACKVLEELKDVAGRGYKEVFFRDEIFTVSRKRTLDICEGMVADKINLSWVCSTRADYVDLEMMNAMKRAGCHMIRVGVESGVQELLDKVKKGVELERVKQVFAWAKQAKLDTHAHLMVGLPGESRETLRKTMDFVRLIAPTVVTYGILTPYPGTPLYESLKAKNPGLGDGTDIGLEKLHVKSYFNENFTSLTPGELSAAVFRAYREFYARPVYILKWLLRIKSADELGRILRAGAMVMNFIYNRGNARNEFRRG